MNRSKTTPIYRGVRYLRCPYCGHQLTVEDHRTGVAELDNDRQQLLDDKGPAVPVLVHEVRSVTTSCCRVRYHARDLPGLKERVDERATNLKGTYAWK